MSDDIQKVESNNGQIAQNVHGDMIYADGDIHIHNSKNKSIKKIKKDFYELRKRMVHFTVAKVLIPLFIFFFFINLFIFKYNNSDIAFHSLGSLSLSIISLIVFYYFNKYYYKDKEIKTEPKEEKAEILFFIDLFFIAWMFYLNFM